MSTCQSLIWSLRSTILLLWGLLIDLPFRVQALTMELMDELSSHSIGEGQRMEQSFDALEEFVFIPRFKQTDCACSIVACSDVQAGANPKLERLIGIEV